MKKFLNLLALILLVIFTINLSSAHAEESSNNKRFILTDSATNENFIVTINTDNGIKTVIVDDGNKTENIVYDTKKNEVFLNGEKLSDEIVNS